MKYLTKADYTAAAADDKYYRGERWQLYRAARLALRTVIKPHSSLELGPYKLPIIQDGDTMDLRASLEPTVLHDARETPWPIDRHYDVFIGLQVFEHLCGKQQEAFAEVQRIADHALLSFPYQWHCPKDPNHHGITRATIDRWTHGAEPESVRIIPSATNHRRILFHLGRGGFAGSGLVFGFRGV